MKKIIALVLVLAMALTSVLALVACETTYDSAVEEAIALAEDMTLEELIAAAQEEIGDNTLIYTRMSSTTDAAATAFTELYGINAEQGSMGSKDSDIYTALSTAVIKDAYASDIMIVQNTAEMMYYVNSGDLLNFSPNSDQVTGVGDDDLDLLTWIYCTKQFTYTKTNASDPEILSNVWQMTGADGKSLSGISEFSLQDPVSEGINMSWLIMLTSDENAAILEAAYESYFGTTWSNNTLSSSYASVSWYFIEQLIGNVSTWHTSDTTTCKNMAYGLLDSTYSDGIASGVVAWVPYAKVKDINSVLVDDNADYLDNFEFAGTTTTVEGFSAFAYKMYIQIPATAQYPYAACLFATYMLSEDGVANSCGSYYGYFSANTDVESADGIALSEWTGVIYEDGDYVYDNYALASKFVLSCCSSNSSY